MPKKRATSDPTLLSKNPRDIPKRWCSEWLALGFIDYSKHGVQALIDYCLDV